MKQSLKPITRRSHYEFQNKNCCTSHERNHLYRYFRSIGHYSDPAFDIHVPPGTSLRLKDNRIYTPGIYTSDITLNNTALEVEVTVDESHINSIRFTNLNESITTMYPFIEPAIEDIAEQVYKKQSLDNIQYSSDTPYTSQLIVQAIETALKKAGTTK